MPPPFDSAPTPLPADDVARALAQCYRLAARRGRAIREAREQAKSAECETARPAEAGARRESAR